MTRRTCFVIRGLEDQETLLHLLELREGWSGSPELRENHTLHGLLLSVLAAGVAGVLSVLSHPAVGQLPAVIYYPCLAAAFGAVCGRMSGTRRHKMTCTKEELQEAKRQIDSTLHKLRETVRTLEGKENPSRYKSQITLANRRIQAFGLAVSLIERELEQLS